MKKKIEKKILKKTNRQTASGGVRFRQVLSGFVRFCQIASGFVRFCQLASADVS
jgi:hypothetical protein